MAASRAANTGAAQTYDGGALPDTLTVFVGDDGSLVETVSVADLLPADVGWNRIGTAQAVTRRDGQREIQHLCHLELARRRRDAR